MTLASGGAYVPACGPPVSISVNLASSAVTPAGCQCGAYVGAVEEMVCVVCVGITERA